MMALWKFTPGIYAYQTDEKTIANKMKKNKKFTLFNEGMNCNHWVFHSNKNSLRAALKTFKRLMSREAYYNSATDVWEA